MFAHHVAKVFDTGAQPGGIVTSPKVLTDHAKKNLKASWTDTHSGPKAGGVALLDEGMGHEAVTMTSTDTQFSENHIEIQEISPP